MRILVVGGVALGATFSTRMRRLSEADEIIIYEKSSFVSYANCGLPYNLSGKITREKLEVATPKSLKDDFNIKVNVNHEVVAINKSKKTIKVKNLKTGKTKTDKYDKLVLGPGARALVLPIPGLDKEKATFTLKNLNQLDEVQKYISKNKPKNAVIFGAGFIGLEVAESLIEAGWNVSVIDIAKTIVKLDSDMSTIAQNELTDNGVNLYLEAFTEKVDSKKKIVILKDGRKIPYDIIFATAGVKPNTEFIKEAGIKVDSKGIVITNEFMQTSDKNIYAGGDIVYSPHAITGKKVYSPLAWGANRQARVIANHIAGIKDQQPTTLNTAIIKIFRKPVAQTGLTEYAANLEGFKTDAVITESNHHAGYYPGTKKVVTKLIYDKKTLKILGAQAIGDSADKKVDIVSTIIKSGGTIYDLQDLNLSYAPPYGSARDVLNILASVAVNTVERKIEQVQAINLPKDAIVIDTRPETISSMGTVEGAINVEKSHLRTSKDLPPKSTKLYLLCDTGHESYNSWSILNGMGYKNLVNIQGGFHLYKNIKQAGEYEPGTNTKKTTSQSANATVSAPKATLSPNAKVVNVDCTGLACPGPILKVSEALKKAKDGTALKIVASDFGFEKDIQIWAKKNNHTVVSVTTDNDNVYATIVKGQAPGANVTEDAKAMASMMLQGRKKATIVLFSGSYDKAVGAFIIAQAAASLGTEVTIFATFWGLSALRTKPRAKLKKKFMEKMFSKKLPKNVEAMPLSQMNMGGMGLKMIKRIMRQQNVASPKEMLQQSIDMGVNVIACTMSMGLMGFRKEELIEGIQYAGAAAYAAESDDSNLTLFI